MWKLLSVSEQTEASPLSERCACDFTLKDESWQFMLLSENRGESKVKVSSFYNFLKPGYKQIQIFSYSYLLSVSIMLI